MPYRGGEGARADLLGGRIEINIAPPPQLLSLIQDGRMRALAYTGSKRSPDLPDVPTMTEAAAAPGGLSPGRLDGLVRTGEHTGRIVDRLNRDMNEVLQSAEMAPVLKRFGYEAMMTTPAEFKTFFAAELRKWPPILKAAGIKPQ